MKPFHKTPAYRLLSPISERLLQGLLASSQTPGDYMQELTRLFTAGLLYLLVYLLFGGLMKVLGVLLPHASWSSPVREISTWCLITAQCWGIWYGLKTSFNMVRLYRFGPVHAQRVGRQWDAVASCSIALAVVMVALTNIPLQVLSVVALMLIWCLTSVIPTVQIWTNHSETDK